MVKNLWRFKGVFCLMTLLCFFLVAFLFLLRGPAAVGQEHILYWGSTGDDVVRVQQKLSQWGYYTGPLDGYYAYETYRAVQDFQRNNGISPDGVVDRGTWENLGLTVTRPVPEVSRGAASDRSNITLLARVIEGEAADEPFIGKVGVGAVILNRLKSASFPNSLSSVIFQDYAFESISNGQAYRPLSEESIQAAQLAMSGYDPTGNAIFFWNPSKPVSPWIWSRNVITRIGEHVFAH
jgi:N-acetylmuramoyl-L-alanine amidase